MSYSQFSTKNADYYLVYESHKSKPKEKIFDYDKIGGLDAIILETGGTSYEDWFSFLRAYDLQGQINTEKVIKNIKKKKIREGKDIPIYYVDVNITKTFLQICLKGGVLGCGSYALFGFTGFLYTCLYVGFPMTLTFSKKKFDILPNISAFLDYFPPEPMTEARNAITARKTEEFIVPMLQKRLGKKPTICIKYGAGHAGIKFDLKHKWLRNTVLNLYSKFNYPMIEKKNLEKIWEINFDKDIRWWTYKEYKTNLF